MSSASSLSCPPLIRGSSVHVLSKESLPRGGGPTTSILIRARSVVQVHPGPPFKSSVNTRPFSLFPVRGISLKKPICQLFANFTIGRMALTLRAFKTLRVKAERLASIRHCRECCPVMSKDVQGSARDCTAVEGAGSHFWSVCGGVVQLVRTPALGAHPSTPTTPPITSNYEP